MSIKKYTVFNLVGSLLPIFLLLITVPIYLRLIGEDRYGILTIVWIFLGYFGIFDLGLGRAVAQRISSVSDAPHNFLNSIFWTALIINLVVGLGVGILFLPLSYFYIEYFSKIDLTFKLELLNSLPWLALSVPVATCSSVFIGTIQGKNSFFALNGILIIGAAMLQLLPLIAVWKLGPNLAFIVISVFSAKIIAALLLFLFCITKFNIKIPIKFSQQQAKSLLSFGGWITITSLVGPLMTIMDRVLIGALIGPKAVAVYTIPFQLVERILIIPSSLASAYFPKFSALKTGETVPLLVKVTQNLAVIMTFFAMCGVYLVDIFLGLWISPDFALESASIAKVLIISFWINSLAIVPFANLQAQGRPDLAAKCHLVEVGPYIALLFFLMHHYGLIGAAFAFGIRVMVDAILFLYLSKIIIECKKFLLIHTAFILIALIISILPSPYIWIFGSLEVLYFLKYFLNNPSINYITKRDVDEGSINNLKK